jgi:hypothetical protein
MGRAYLRVDPAMFERKVIQQEYPPLAYAAYSAILCLADSQPVRGRFRDERLMRALLGPLARQAKVLVERGDVIPASEHHECGNCPTGHGCAGQLYVDGWDEWQEGDWQVKERMSRVREKKRNGRKRNAGDGSESNPTVLAGRGGSVSEAGQPGRYKDAYKAFAHCQGHKPAEAEQKWIDDLSKDFGREIVAAAFYDDATPSKAGLMGRVSKKLRRRAA